MFFSDLNSVVNYIEQNLTSSIDIDELAGMLGTNQDTFKRIFTLICGVSVTEYIKKRRLTVCCADLKELSVLDVAFKYGYTSSAGFSRAFFSFHHCYPSEVRQNADVKLNAFLPIKIDTALGINELKYSVEQWDERRLFGYFVESEIRALPQVVWNEYQRFLAKYQPDEYCGITLYKKNNMAEFWFCLNENKGFTETLKIPAGEWLVLEYSGTFNEISNFVRSVYRDIGKQINQLPAGKIDMEIYSQKGVKLCFLLK